MSFRYYPLSEGETARRRPMWESFYNRRACGAAGIDLAKQPDWDECDRQFMPAKDIPLARTRKGFEELDDAIRGQLRWLHVTAMSRYQGDMYPSLSIPRKKYGQSQALGELFGCRLVRQESEEGLYYPVPCVETAADVMRLKPRPIEECMYAIAIEYARYMHEAVNGELAVRCPILTGPIDTANYLLGSTRLMEWVYEEPKALKMLLGIITDTLINVIRLYQDVVEGHTAPELIACVDKGYLICSEIRHLISDDTYLEFEAPYLRAIGEACGPFAVHSCGCFDRTMRSTMLDPNIFAADFQVRETDVAIALAETSSTLTFNVRKSHTVEEKYLWSSDEDYYAYLMSAFTAPSPLIFVVYDVDTYRRVQDKLSCDPSGMFGRRI